MAGSRTTGLALVASAAALAAAALGAGALAGCGGAAHPSARRPTPLAQAQRTHEYPSPPPPRQTPSQTAGSAADAIDAFATIYINWTPDTVAAQMQELAAQSIGQARSAMQLAAAETGHDYELQQGGISNRGSVEAIAPLIGTRDKYAVVTRELTTATNTATYEGLRPAWHLAIATVTQAAPGQWVVSGWQPEN